MGVFKDLTGQRFGKLYVIEYVGIKNHKAIFKCKCDCGNETIAQGTLLSLGKTRSCGCLAANNINQTKHGKRRTKLYGVWCTMKSRCNNPNAVHYQNYGGRGIKVCDEWRLDFQSFYDWAYANGYREGLSIDRINVNGDYEPSNCRFVTMKVQNNNRGNNALYTFNGETKTLSQWADESCVKPHTFMARIYAGWPFERALKEESE